MKLKRKKAIITGAGGGIGSAIAVAFAQNGCDCVIADIDLDAASAVASDVKKIGREAMEFKVDVGNKSEVDLMIETAIESFGTIDILVTVAGALTTSPFNELPKKDWDWLKSVHVDGTFFLFARCVTRNDQEEIWKNHYNILCGGDYRFARVRTLFDHEGSNHRDDKGFG